MPPPRRQTALKHPPPPTPPPNTNIMKELQKKKEERNTLLPPPPSSISLSQFALLFICYKDNNGHIARRHACRYNKTTVNNIARKARAPAVKLGTSYANGTPRRRLPRQNQTDRSDGKKRRG